MEQPILGDLSAAQIERLALLAEEMGEAAQVVGKILRHGIDSDHYGKMLENNRQLLEKELGDVMLAYRLLRNAGDVHENRVEARVQDKAGRIQEFLHYQPSYLFNEWALESQQHCPECDGPKSERRPKPFHTGDDPGGPIFCNSNFHEVE